MTLDEFQVLALKFRKTYTNRDDIIRDGTFGLIGEAGEFCNIIKKNLIYGNPLDVDHITKELGDILWTVASLADAFDISLGKIAERNIEKLSARYGDTVGDHMGDRTGDGK